MENNKKDKHLDIETVTPDTDDGKPNDQKHNHRIENEVANAESQTGTSDKEQESKQKSSEGDSESTTSSKEDKEEDGGSSDIETVSP